MLVELPYYLSSGQSLVEEDSTGGALRVLHMDNWERTWASGNVILEGCFAPAQWVFLEPQVLLIVNPN